MKSAILGIFLPRELMNTIHAGLYFFHKHLPTHHCIWSYFKEETLPRKYLGEKIAEIEEIKEGFLEEKAFGLMITVSKTPIQQVGTLNSELVTSQQVVEKLK